MAKEGVNNNYKIRSNGSDGNQPLVRGCDEVAVHDPYLLPREGDLRERTHPGCLLSCIHKATPVNVGQ